MSPKCSSEAYRCCWKTNRFGCKSQCSISERTLRLNWLSCIRTISRRCF